MIEQIVSCDGHTINYIFKPALSNRAKTICVLLHGIFSDKNENGRYQRLSNMLTHSGLDTIRFDFRGNGESKLESNQFTLSGAINDLSAVLLSVVDNGYTHINLIASSFSSCIAILYNSLPQRVAVQKFSLLNPVVDLYASVLMARQENEELFFDEATIYNIGKNGKAELANGFSVSSHFFNEICFLQPYQFIVDLAMPMIVFHGTLDKKVDHKISIAYFSEKKNCQLVILEGGEHSFNNVDHENRVFTHLVKWLTG